MSRAFLKDDAVEDPIMVPARAPLPRGVPNYVTPRGLEQLRAERARLDRERAALDKLPPESNDRKRGLALLGGKRAALDERIASARLVDPAKQPPGEVRFGAHVALRSQAGETRSLQIVGVDESDAESGRIPFTAPVARSLMGKRTGETVAMPARRGTETWTLEAISYGSGAGE